MSRNAGVDLTFSNTQCCKILKKSINYNKLSEQIIPIEFSRQKKLTVLVILWYEHPFKYKRDFQGIFIVKY